MKSQPEMSISSKPTVNKHGITKARPRDRDVTHEEMQALLAKLKELVPNMPRNKRLSKLEIIQYVIDYIVDLQIALETHPSSRPCSTTPSGSPPARQPLGVISPAQNTVVNTCAAQEASHIEKIPQHLPELVISTSRPVSC